MTDPRTATQAHGARPVRLRLDLMVTATGPEAQVHHPGTDVYVIESDAEVALTLAAHEVAAELGRAVEEIVWEVERWHTPAISFVGTDTNWTPATETFGWNLTDPAQARMWANRIDFQTRPDQGVVDLLQVPSHTRMHWAVPAVGARFVHSFEEFRQHAYPIIVERLAQPHQSLPPVATVRPECLLDRDVLADHAPGFFDHFDLDHAHLSDAAAARLLDQMIDAWRKQSHDQQTDGDPS